MTLPTDIIIRADASSRIGGGHVMRCLTLADAVRERGAAVTFICADLVDGLRRRIRESGHRLVEIGTEDPGSGSVDWDAKQMGADIQRADAFETLGAIGSEAKPLVIVDHYRLDHVWEEAIRRQARVILAVDDLANRQHACDILLDQSLGRTAGDYRPLVPQGCSLLLGPQYALLRPQFAAARQNVLDRWLHQGPQSRLFVFLGIADLEGITGEVAEALVALREPRKIDVVISTSAPSFQRVARLAEQDPRIHLHTDAPDMAGLMAKADLAVGAAGTSSWERCCLGLPTVSLVLAGNQRMNASRLSQAGACVVASTAADAAIKVKALLAAPNELARMAAAAMAIVDGRGRERVADQLLHSLVNTEVAGLTLREANADDSIDIWLWRNDPLVRAVSGDGRAIPWQDHVQWWRRSAGSERTILYIGSIQDRSVGMVRFDLMRADNAAPAWRVSINLAPASRGRGIGTPLLSAACAALRQQKGAAPLLAEIRPDNRASIQAFQHAGFIPAHSKDAALLTYMLPADQPVRAGQHEGGWIVLP